MDEVQDYSSQNLRDLRKSAEYSRRELIDELSNHGVKMHPTTLRRIEDGNQGMKVQEAVALSDIFGLSLDDFVGQPVNQAEADLRAKLNTMKLHESAIFENRKDWLHKLEKLPEAIGDSGIHPEQSKAVRDVQRYMQDTIQFRDWLRSPDFPDDRDTSRRWYDGAEG